MLPVRLCALVTAVFTLAWAGPAPVRKTLTVPLRILVARCPVPGATPPKLEPVKGRAWVDAHVQEAQKILEPHGVRLVARTEEFTPKRCTLLTRGQRNGLAQYVRMDHEVTVVVMRRIRDLDVPSYNLMGVHWRHSGRARAVPGRRWIFLTARAKPPVLAHELAHYFGIRHDPKGGNLMTPGPSSPLWKHPSGAKPAAFQPHLTQRQAARLRAGIGRFLVRRR